MVTAMKKKPTLTRGRILQALSEHEELLKTSAKTVVFVK